MSTHLTELLKNNMAELLSYGEVQKLLKELPKEQADIAQGPGAVADHHLGHPARAADPACRARLHSRPVHHPRRHRRRHFAARATRCCWPSTCAHASRARSARSIPSAGGYLPLIALSAKWEQAFAESIVGEGDARTARDAALEAHRIHHAGTREIRGGRARRRSARCWSRPPLCGRLSAASSSVSGPIRRFCRNPRSIPGPG